MCVEKGQKKLQWIELEFNSLLVTSSMIPGALQIGFAMVKYSKPEGWQG
jgi:hypothetical protein